MNKFIKIAVFTLLFILSATLFAGAADSISIPITVEEQNGIAVSDYFFRRGIPIEKGVLYSADDICIKENGSCIPSSAEVLQKHPDGSISWILVSANIDLQPNEVKNLTVTNGKSIKTSTVVEESPRLTVTSDNIRLVFGNNGIHSVYYNNQKQLDGNINVYVNDGVVTSYLNATDISVLKHTDSYVKIKIKGKISETVDGEMYVTLPEGSSKFEVEYRITAKDNVDILSTGLLINTPYSKADGTVITDDCLDLGTIQAISYDNTRFRGAASQHDKTGYIIDNEKIMLAPIVNGRTKTYYDGVARTNHVYFTFSGDAESWDKTLAVMPAVTILPQQFVKAGQIKTTKTGALVDDAIKTLKFSYTKRNNRFEAGAVSRVINSVYGLCDSYDSQAGEVGYNMGLAYMQTGDAELYRYIDECTEARCDIAVYKGKYSEIYGEARTRMGQFTSDAAFYGHPYYGDQSALYMGYILTGNEYVGEIYKASMEHDLKYMYNELSCGTYIPRIWTWSRDASTTPAYTTYYESRGGIRARTMYLAYLHFGDERYLKAAREIVQWMANVQLENGSFLQATYDNGMPLMQAGQTQYPNKDYISLYGMRGVSQLLEFDAGESLSKKVTLKFADYLCSQNEAFGPGFWYPNGDVNVYAVNENDTRGKSPMTDILAVDVLCTAFEITGNERYLKNMLSLLESYMCSATGGLGYWYTAMENTPWVVSDEVDFSRSSSLFKSSDNLMTVIENYRDKVIALGYENVSVVFTDGAKKCSNAEIIKYAYPEVTQNIFTDGETKVFFAANNFAPHSGDWNKNLKFVFDDNRLWQGEKNVVENPYCITLSRYTNQYDTLTAVQRPIFVDEISGSANIWIDEYNKDKIELSYSGSCELGLRIEGGTFAIENGANYNIEAEKVNNRIQVVITKGGDFLPHNGALYIRLSENGSFISNVGMKSLSGTGLENISADSAITALQIKSVIDSAFNSDITLDSPDWNSLAPQLIGAARFYGLNVLEKSGIRAVTVITPDEDVTDSQAVQIAADALNVEYYGDKLHSDVFLPAKSLYGCSVEWNSEDESILSSQGVLDRQNIDKESITLTAVVTKNSEKATKSFTIPLLPKEEILQKPSSGLAETAFSLVPQSGSAQITFSCTPEQNNIDGIIVIGDSDFPSDSLSNVSYMLRFSPQGYIDAVNNYGSSAVNHIPYEAGKKYTFRVVMRMNDGNYDAYVTPEGEEEILLAKNYTPRSTGNPVKKADVMWLWTSSLDSYELDYCSHYYYPKTDIKNNYLYDENGLMFGKYNVNNSLTLDKALNWVEVPYTSKTSARKACVYLSGDGIDSAFDALIRSRLADRRYNGTENVTAGDIARILTVKKAIHYESESSVSIPGVTNLYGDDFNDFTGDFTFTANIAGQTFAGLPLLEAATRPIGAVISAENKRAEFGSSTAETLLLNRLEPQLQLATPFVVEFDYCQTVLGSNNINTLYRCTDYNGTYRGVWLSVKGGVLRAYDKNEEKVICKINENQVYSIKLYVNPTEKAYNIYLDGECIARFGFDDGLTAFGRLLHINFPAGDSKFYFDNFSIYTDVREAELYNLVKTLSSMVIAADEIVLPTALNDGYQISWSSSDADIVNPATGKVTRGEEAATVILTATVSDSEWIFGKSLSFEVEVASRAEALNILAKTDFDGVTSVSKGAFVGENLLAVSSNGASVEASGKSTVLKLDKNAGDTGFANLYMDFIKENTISGFTVEFDFMTEALQDINTIFSMSGTVGERLLNAVQLSSDKNNIYCYGGLSEGGVERITLIENYSPSAWYSFRIYVDASDQSYDVYENGILLAENVAFCPEIGTQTPKYIKRPFMTNSGTNATNPYYIDSFIVYDYIEGSIGSQLSYDKSDKLLTGKTPLTGNLAEYENAALVIAVYCDGKLIKAKTGEADGYHLKAELDTSDLSSGDYISKTFVFETADNIRPLCAPCEKAFTINGFISQ